MEYNLRANGYSLDLPPTPSGSVHPNAMSYEETRAGSENCCDVEDELDSIDKIFCLLIINGGRNIILKALSRYLTHYLHGHKKHLMLKMTLSSCYLL